MRTSSPCVALPFDPSRVRLELVGFLLHPVSRSETWRRLGTRRTQLRSSQGFHSKDAAQDSWRGAESCHRNRLADVSQTIGTGRLEGNRTAKIYSLILRDLTDFLKAFRVADGP